MSTLLWILVGVWTVAGLMFYLVCNDRVRLPKQKVVFRILCGPGYWSLKMLGTSLSWLEVKTEKFWQWLFKSE